MLPDAARRPPAAAPQARSSLGLYADRLGLLTDLYELTMACAYLRAGLERKEAVFHVHFRKSPFEGAYAVACGLGYVVDYLEGLEYGEADLGYLAGLKGSDEKPLFDGRFLDYLRKFEFRCDVDAVPEGTVVFPQEPLLRVRGPLIQCQLLETALLNFIHFQTLIATKASRVVTAARGKPVIEFGLRRAQGPDGGLAASRAAYVGGCEATSNTLAGRLFGIPVRGTLAHSWVMAFEDELESFRAWARAMPNNSIFLVDTYHTLEGVKKAVEAGRELRRMGHEMGGIRLDSGDLAYLSVEARRILDAAGFPDAIIVGSNELDEKLIESLVQQGAKIDAWGVGTKLVTGYDQPALGVVYKISAVRDPGGPWRYMLKLAEKSAKISTPGILDVRRFKGPEGNVADMIFDVEKPASGPWTIVDPEDPTRQKTVPAGTPHADLLEPVFRAGKRVAELGDLHRARERAARGLGEFHPAIRRFVNPHEYPVGIERGLHAYRRHLILAARGLPE